MTNLKQAGMAVITGSFALATGVLGVAADACAETVTTVLSGLRNPRGVATDMGNGAAYVAEAGTGEAGTGRISRWWNGTSVVVADGLASAIVGLAFGPDGTMYVSEMERNGLLGVLVLQDPSQQATAGALIAVSPSGSRHELAAGMLTLPGGVAVANDGAVFVSNMSISPTDGELLKIDP